MLPQAGLITPEPLPPTIRVPRPGPRLSVGWTITLLFGGLFVWWYLGLSGVIQPLLAVPMLAWLVLRGRVRMPKIFWAWLLFIGWMLVSGTQVKDFQGAVSFGWRASMYIASTIIFLYVYNASRESLPARRLMNVLAWFWVLTVVGGLLGMAYPNHTFHSLVEAILPQRFLSNAFVKALVIPSTTGAKAFTGTHIYRVKSPFIYTNQWGSAFALTLPFALSRLRTIRRGLWRFGLFGLLVLSIVPLVFSLDRGSWLSVGVGTSYALIRLAAGRNRRLARTARALIVGGIIVTGIVLLTSLGQLVLLRSSHGYGDQHRLILYSSSLTLVERSPWLGYGGPVSISVINPAAPPGPSAGTHGQFWTIIVSNGIPGLVFFLGWFILAFFKTSRQISGAGGRDADARFWCHVAIFTAMAQMPYYELIPWGLPIVMVAAAVALREAGPVLHPRPGPPMVARARTPVRGAVG